MDMRPQNPALCSPQGMSPPWKARAGAGGVSPGSPSVISCSRGCSCCSRAVLRADSLPRGASTARCHPGSGVRSRDRLLPCHAGGRWNRRMKALGAGCSPPQLPTGCSPRGPSAGWRPYMASRPTRGRGSHRGSPCPGKGPRARSPGPATTTTPPRGSQPRGHSGTSPRAHSRAPVLPRRLFFPGQTELFKAMGVTGHLRPGQGASPLPPLAGGTGASTAPAPRGHPAPLDPHPTGGGMRVPPVHGAGRKRAIPNNFLRPARPGFPGASPWPLSSPSLPPTLLPSAPPLRLNDFHMGLWQPEPSLPALSEISKFRRNMKIVKRPFLRG